MSQPRPKETGYLASASLVKVNQFGLKSPETALEKPNLNATNLLHLKISDELLTPHPPSGALSKKKKLR
jgi:hypothetical protein